MEPPIAQASSVSNDSHELVESGIDRPANSSNVKANDLEWSNHPRNPLNLPAGQKLILMSMVSLSAFVTTAGTSVVSPATAALQKEFDVGETAALLPLSLYVFALASGPVVGGPLSETVGRMPVYYVFFPLGALFTLGAGLTRNFGAFCFLRFAAGFCWAPSLTVAAGSISETFAPKARGLMMALFIFMPFLGPGFGPVLGAYAANRQGWPWTQWVLLFITVVCIILIALTPETFPPVIKKRVFKNRSESSSHPQRLERLWAFATISLFRPVHMLFTEPIITFICLYVAINFGVLFSFFAAVPYTFETVYAFNIEQTGLVFFSIVIGSFLGLVTIIICDVALYRRQAPHYPPGAIPPEFRLYPAMIGGFGLPLGLFWFAWTSKQEVSWASPAAAIIPYSWGNLCVFVATAQFASDTYHGNVMASASSAMTLSRYGFAGAFPLFILQMLRAMGISWAVSVFGFITLALIPIPWVLFKFGPTIRARSRYETL